MIDRLKYMLDECENNPKAKEILLKVAALKEENQELALQMIEMVIKT